MTVFLTSTQSMIQRYWCPLECSRGLRYGYSSIHNISAIYLTRLVVSLADTFAGYKGEAIFPQTVKWGVINKLLLNHRKTTFFLRKHRLHWACYKTLAHDFVYLNRPALLTMMSFQLTSGLTTHWTDQPQTWVKCLTDNSALPPSS